MFVCIILTRGDDILEHSIILADALKKLLAGLVIDGEIKKFDLRIEKSSVG